MSDERGSHAPRGETTSIDRLDVRFDTDVLVVGTGPMGAVSALALATYGVRVHAISKWNWLANTPRAHITNQRTMEVLRDLGLEHEVSRSATSWELMGDTTFATSLSGVELARLRTWGTGEQRHGDYVKGSPCPMLDIPQSDLEPIVVNAAASRGARFDFNTEYVDHHQDAAGVKVRLRDRLSEQEYAVTCRYLVGADGAGSSVVEQLELPFEGEMGRAATAYVWFRADLSHHVAHRPSILHWIVSPSSNYGEIGMGVLRAIRPWDTWIAGWGFDLSGPGPDFDPDAVIARIRQYVGDPDLEIEVLKTSQWFINEAFATQYSRGRVLCGGDAVHRHPPSSGLGSNTCIQDAFNLSWKLAYVLSGHAGGGLLDSYSEERAPVGRQVVKRANQSRRDYAPLMECFEGSVGGDAPGIETRLDDPGPAGIAARRALTEALELKNYEFNAQGVELNQRYTSVAVITDDGVATDQVSTTDPELFLIPTTKPGAKLPHAWLVDGSGRRISTLDMVGKGKFTLITGLAGEAWATAVDEMSLPFLTCVVVGRPSHMDLYREWARVSEIDEAGALLVRPDGYVAWRHRSAIPEATNIRHVLNAALARVLDLSTPG
jgi:2,4-dichlorophenol 6-monooxygenase